jgi:hypothetical protein
MPSLGGLLGLDLVAHDADVLGGRADEGDAVGIEDIGELGVLRQEAVARVDASAPVISQAARSGEC